MKKNNYELNLLIICLIITAVVSLSIIFETNSYQVCKDTCNQYNMSSYILVKDVCQCIKSDLICTPNKIGTIALECKEIV